MKRLLLLLSLNFILNSSLNAQVPQIERDALVAFYNATYGANWTNNTNWNTSNPVSTWYGITVENNHVTQINLSNNNIWPNLPPEIGNLQELVTLNIPDEVSFFSSTSTIPAEIGNLSKLEYLDLRSWGLSGEIPKELGNLSNLLWLDLRFNSFSGSIPQELTNLASLNVLVLSGNQFSGPIPNFTTLLLLNYFWIDNNNFQFGDLEPNFSTYTGTSGLDFVYSPQNNIGERYDEAVAVGSSRTFNTNVSGSQNTYDWYRINADGSDGGYIGSGMSINVTVNTVDNFKWFYYYDATSSLIPGLTLRSEFFKLGDLPSNHPDYDALIAVYNALNDINWDTTKPIYSWSPNNDLTFDPVTDRVTELRITGNSPITGVIPPEIGDLTELTSLDFFLEDLSGDIPIELWNLTKLKTLFLGAQESNLLRLPNGIPPQIANLQDLEWLNLTQIPLTQPLQPELFNLPNLQRLRIVGCGLTGTIPKELASITDVLASDNEFEGTIPQEFIDAIGNQTLSITGNYFDFNDLEPMVLNHSYQNFFYNPQRTKDVEQDLEFLPGNDITLTVDDTRHNKFKNSKGAGDVYQWFKDNVAISGANASSYTITNAQASDSGVYYCQITNTLVPDLVINRANITLLIDTSLSIDENDKERFAVYPNPSSNFINVRLNNIDKEAVVSIFDTNGRKIREQPLKTENTVLDISGLNSGMYLLQLKTTEGIITKHIVKY
ncbi:T9SS type A sorting domain-containing protein [Hyunsoonleella rubra]|uniref:T9SS type A sorting domain-containing protein n=1 Tax=Hyunsoonleella rubra TaxID=1737062 RepID=A0ABW5TGB0_9FLAO